MSLPSNITILIGVVVISIIVLLFWKNPDPPSGKCSLGDAGSCNMDSDCGGPKQGKCYKDKNGSCECVCNVGYSGKNCQIAGIPWNSPHCMGNNKQTPGKDKDGMCICPPGKWKSVTDAPGIGYVQCYSCVSGYGPFPYENKADTCELEWGQANYLSNDCHPQSSGHACDEFSDYAKMQGPGNQQGSIKIGGVCNGTQLDSCRCDSKVKGSYSRDVCSVVGWLQKNRSTTETCELAVPARPCNSYACKTP